MLTNKRAQRTTQEIKKLILGSNMDFDSVVNDALNEYLPKIFSACPFADELCIGNNQCITCKNSQSHSSL